MAKKNKEIDTDVIYLEIDGRDLAFEFLDIVEYNYEQYAILLPLYEEDPDVVIVKMIEEPGTDMVSYAGVGEEEILDAVFELFLQQVEE